MNFDIIKSIKCGRYTETQLLVKKSDIDILKLAFDTGSLALYTYRCLLLLDQKNSDLLHEQAFELISCALVYYYGAYSSGSLHVRRMIKLCPDGSGYLDYLLFLYSVPESLVTRQEAYCIVQNILSVNPYCSYTLRIKDEIEDKLQRSQPEPEPFIPHDEQHNEFVRLMHTGFYEQAKALLHDYSEGQVGRLLRGLTTQHKSVAFYTYAIFMLLDHETAERHLLAGQLLTEGLAHIHGAVSGALFHARRALALAPESLPVLEFFLSFYTKPEPLLTNEEARACALSILALDPQHKQAQKIAAVC